METIDVVSLNLWNRFGPWEPRLAALRHGLRALAPDIVGVQEIVRAPGFEQGELIAEGRYYVAFGACNRYDDVLVGNGVLSRFPILHEEVIPLPDGRTTERRVLVYARIKTPHGELPFFVTHLNWRLDEGHVRQLQVRAVADAIEARCPSRDAMSPVLTGDFNAEPDSDEIRFLRGLTSLGGRSVFYADAWIVGGDGTPGVTFSKKNPFAEPLREPERRIDYIFVRGHDDPSRHGDVLSAKRCFDQPHEGVFPSDHFGVQATLRVR